MQEGGEVTRAERHAKQIAYVLRAHDQPGTTHTYTHNGWEWCMGSTPTLLMKRLGN
jgi:hypothetical protein